MISIVMDCSKLLLKISVDVDLYNAVTVCLTYVFVNCCVVFYASKWYC